MHLDKRFSVFCPKKLKEILGFSKSRRERPIKTMFEDPTVAPRAGAWIETTTRINNKSRLSLRGQRLQE